jgi:WD40-like Beta Propeller Repeat
MVTGARLFEGDGLSATLAISPDGTHIAYAANTPEPNLVIRAIGSLEATPIAGIVGARQPLFSPDGKWVAFFDGASELRKVPVSGGGGSDGVQVCVAAWRHMGRQRHHLYEQLGDGWRSLHRPRERR